MALYSIYALPQGIPVADLAMGGLGSPWPRHQCLAVFLFSSPRTAKANLAFNVRVVSSIGAQRVVRMFAHTVALDANGINSSPMHNVYMCKTIVRN
jgi:hypothetical protein